MSFLCWLWDLLRHHCLSRQALTRRCSDLSSWCSATFHCCSLTSHSYLCWTCRAAHSRGELTQHQSGFHRLKRNRLKAASCLSRCLASCDFHLHLRSHQCYDLYSLGLVLDLTCLVASAVLWQLFYAVALLWKDWRLHFQRSISEILGPSTLARLLMLDAN